jgi:hypothetical protein
VVTTRCNCAIYHLFRGFLGRSKPRTGTYLRNEAVPMRVVSVTPPLFFFFVLLNGPYIRRERSIRFIRHVTPRDVTRDESDEKQERQEGGAAN